MPPLATTMRYPAELQEHFGEHSLNPSETLKRIALNVLSDGPLRHWGGCSRVMRIGRTSKVSRCGLPCVTDMDRAETIGTGGFAKVKKAKHCLTGETVSGVTSPSLSLSPCLSLHTTRLLSRPPVYIRAAPQRQLPILCRRLCILIRRWQSR
jgi:hypothetical protein